MGANIPPPTPSAFQRQGNDNLPGSFPAPLQQQADPGDIIAAVSAFMARAATQRPDVTPLTPGFPASPYHTRTPIEIIVCTQATFPTLTSGSIPVFVYVSDFHHMIYWDGSTPLFSDGGNRFMALFEVDPGAGWALYDGSTVAALNADGTTTNVALPDLTSMANLAAFLEAGGTNSGPTAAVAPTFSGTPAVLTGSVSAPTLSINNFTPAGTNSAPVFSGTPAAITSNTFTPIALATTAMTSLAGSATSYTPAGTNSAPTFTGTPGAVTGTASTPNLTMNSYTPAGTISTTGEPRKLVRRPYFRL